jgi:acetyl esterase
VTPLSAQREAIRARIEGAALRAVFALPRPVRRSIAGRPLVVDGQTLALEAQLVLRLMRLGGHDGIWTGSVSGSRAALESGARTLATRPGPVARTAVTIDGPGGALDGTLYTPQTPDTPPAGSPLLVYYHGGGWVLGSVRTHDDLCALLAREAGVRVLSVGYRLAPEHPFPAPVEDARAAYDFAVANAASWGADPGRVAVGGDSAGANLAAVVAASGPAQRPAFALLFYPRTDFTTRRRSHELFKAGPLLTEQDMAELESRYLGSADPADPSASVLLTPDLSRFPPTYLSTAGFDPLRDEGDAFAAKLAASGVTVRHSRQVDLVHGYATMVALGGRFGDAVTEAAAALRTGLGTGSRTDPRTGSSTAPDRT